jgi:hypothetical protein
MLQDLARAQRIQTRSLEHELPEDPWLALLKFSNDIRLQDDVTILEARFVQ